MSAHPPDIYPFTYRLARLWGKRTIIDIGWSRTQQLSSSQIDLTVHNLGMGTIEGPGRRIEQDLAKDGRLKIDPQIIADSVVICTGVVERLADPVGLLASLSDLVRLGALLVVSASDRQPLSELDDDNPGSGSVRRWTTDEFAQLLSSTSLEPDFIGLTRDNDKEPVRRTILAVVDGSRTSTAPAADFRVLGVMTSFNEEDIIETSIDHLLNEGVEVHVVDNWSTDSTFDRLERRARSGVITLERFPSAGPTGTYDWAALLARVCEVGAASGADWIMHHDADELRDSPWRDVTLRDSLWAVDRAGFNVVDHTVIEFWPTARNQNLPITDRRHFLFGGRSGHFVQMKTWRRSDGPARLADSGGHDVLLSNQRVFPHKFLLRHYPVRSQQHGERKVFAERAARWNRDERGRGWHTHYDSYKPGDSFLRAEQDLLVFDESRFQLEFFTERLSGISLPGAPP